MSLLKILESVTINKIPQEYRELYLRYSRLKVDKISLARLIEDINQDGEFRSFVENSRSQIIIDNSSYNGGTNLNYSSRLVNQGDFLTGRFTGPISGFYIHSHCEPEGKTKLNWVDAPTEENLRKYLPELTPKELKQGVLRFIQEKAKYIN